MEYQGPAQQQVTQSAPSQTTEETTSSQQDEQQNTVGNQAVQSGMGAPEEPNNGLGRTPGSLADVRKMNVADVSSQYGNARSARPLLQQVFNSDWFVAKAALVRDKWADGSEKASSTEAMTDLMKKFLELREWETDETLSQVRDIDVMSLPLARGLDPEQRLKWGSAGSQSLTSDIDINLKGVFNTQAVELFNARFLSRGWGFEAGIVYDVNVYAKDFMDGFDVMQSQQDKTVGVIKPNAEVELEGEAKEQDAADQEIWSLVKMRRYMTEGEWDTYKKGILGDAQDPAQLAQFKEVEARHDRWKKELDDEVARIENDIEVAIGNLQDGGKALSSHDKSDIADMAASNRIYEAKLKDIIALRGELARLSKLPPSSANKKKYAALGLELRTKLSEAAMFANEAYVTDGAVNHVVVGVQIGGSGKFLQGQKDSGKLGQETTKIEIELPQEQFLHSFNEQVADSIKELGHYKDVGEAFYQGGKYLARMGMAVDRLPGTSGVENLAGFKTLGADALSLKSDDKLSFSDKFAAVNKSAQSNLGTADNAAIRGMLVKFGVDVTKAYKAEAAKSKGQQPQQQESTEQPSEQQVVEQAQSQGNGDEVFAELQQKLKAVRERASRIGQSAQKLDTE